MEIKHAKVLAQTCGKSKAIDYLVTVCNWSVKDSNWIVKYMDV